MLSSQLKSPETAAEKRPLPLAPLRGWVSDQMTQDTISQLRLEPG
jgi:hypothetical protein